MSGAAKMRRTEITVKNGNQTKNFEVSQEAGRSLVSLLEELIKNSKKIAKVDDDDDEYVLAEDVFPDLKDPQKLVGIVFRGIRFKNNLTQSEVAARLGLDQSDVSKIERGERAVGKALAKKIQKEFGIDYRRFL